MEKLIITVAITGGMHGKVANPNIPEQPEEQAQQVVDAWNAGASVAHIHARNKDGVSVQDVAIYKEIGERIRAKGCDIIIQYTTGGSPHMTIEEKLQSIEANPEMASLNMGLTNTPLGNGKYYAYIIDPPQIIHYVESMNARNIKPEMEVYAPNMIRQVNMLIEKGLLKKPYYVNFVMGMVAQGTVAATRQNFFFMVDQLPPDTIYNVCALGPGQLPMTSYSILSGGMARVGLEDNIYYAKGELAKSNAQLVERAARIANEVQRPIASPEEARRILGLEQVKL